MSNKQVGSDFTKIKFDDNLCIYCGGGCNSVILNSRDREKALVVDTKYFKGAKKLREEVTAKDNTVINTHFHIDHARGNKLYPNAHIISGSTIWWLWDFDTAYSKRPDTILNPGQEIILHLDQEKIHVLSMGKAHSANDCVVYFEDRKLLMAGDLVWEHIHPMVVGSNIKLWLQALKKLENKYEIDTLIPGHGSICDKNAFFAMQEYFNSIAEAAGDRTRLSILRDKYKEYQKIPLVSGVDRVAACVKKEKKLE